MSQHQVNRRFMVEWLTPLRLAMVVRGVVVVQCSMNWVNTAALVMSGRGFVREAPQVVHRQRVVPLLVVPLRFICAPQWQRGRFFGIGIRHHRRLPQGGCNTGYFGLEGWIYARGAYIPCVRAAYREEIIVSGHTF